MKLFLVLAAALGLAASARVHLGETPAQVTTRHGPALGSPSNTLPEVHVRDGLVVEVTYRKGRCAWISYRRVADGGRTTFTPPEARALLTANAGDDLPWRPAGDADTWTTAAGRLRARVPAGAAPAGVALWTCEFLAAPAKQTLSGTSSAPREPEWFR